MTRETSALLDAFEHLPAEEKRTFTEEVLRRTLPLIPALLKTRKSALPPPPYLHPLKTIRVPIPQRGEVWLIDFGVAGKTRPALTISVFLKAGAFLVQGITTFPTVKALHRLGKLPSEAFEKVMGGLLRWLGHFQE